MILFQSISGWAIIHRQNQPGRGTLGYTGVEVLRTGLMVLLLELYPWSVYWKNRTNQNPAAAVYFIGWTGIWSCSCFGFNLSLLSLDKFTHWLWPPAGDRTVDYCRNYMGIYLFYPAPGDTLWCGILYGPEFTISRNGWPVHWNFPTSRRPPP